MLATATIFWGLAGAVSKYFFNQALSPLVLATVRLTLSGLLLLLILSLLRRPGLLRLRPADAGKMIIFGIAGMGCVQFFYLYTISQLECGHRSLPPVPGPSLNHHLRCVVEKGEPRTVWPTGPAAGPGGSALIVADQALCGLSQHWAGLLSGFASALAMAFYVLSGKSLLERYNPWVVLCYGLLFGAVPFWFLEPPWVILQPPLWLADLALLRLYRPLRHPDPLWPGLYGTALPQACPRQHHHDAGTGDGRCIRLPVTGRNAWRHAVGRVQPDPGCSGYPKPGAEALRVQHRTHSARLMPCHNHTRGFSSDLGWRTLGRNLVISDLEGLKEVISVVSRRHWGSRDGGFHWNIS